MITHAKIKNFMGIENEIILDCMANNKIKRKDSPVVKTYDNENILKVIGIIGNNGSGKTSILNALATVQTFINFPSRKSKENLEFIEQIKKLPRDLLKEILADFNDLDLPLPNINHFNEDVYIEIELYIHNDEERLNGYYTYSLLYDNNYKKNGVKEEKLVFRKKYNSKKKKYIFCVNNVIESEIGTKILYENNTNIMIDKDIIQYYKVFGEEIVKKMEFVYEKSYIDLAYFRKKHLSEFESLCNIADEKIKYTKIEKKDDEEKVAYFNSKGNKLYVEQLSTGTRKTIILGCKLIEAIENNKIIVFDELESSLHPSLAIFILSIMQKNTMRTYSQLIFTTQSLFLPLMLDNDQLYFINNKEHCYKFMNISEAIKNGIITKDKTIPVALAENLLINNPSKEKISVFIDRLINYEKKTDKY